MSPAARARAEAKAERMLNDMALDELREALKLTQESLAESLHVNQAAISKVERRSDMLISTLRKIIEAMGSESRGNASWHGLRPECKGSRGD